MILKAAWVAPVSAPPIRDGAVAFDGDRIVAVGRAADVATRGQPVIDLGSVLLTPGLVNPHTHLELTCYAGRLPPASFWEWLPGLVKLRAARGQVDRERQGVHDGAWQSLRAGVTCVGDISRRNLHWPVLKSIPIRKVCFVELLTLADDPPRDPIELRAGVEAVEEDALLTVGVTPHAPYTVPAEHIAAAVRLAHEIHRPWCTHWAETREELAFLRGDADAFPPYIRALLAQCDVYTPRMSAIALLEQCCRGARAGALAHFNYAAVGDAERLAAAGHSVLYCPRAHRFFGHDPHPFQALMAAGVNVALGTDSAASNESLVLLEEPRFVRRNVPDAPAADVLLRMVTLAAARALGLESQIGSLEAGKRADLAAFPCAPDARDPVAALIDAAPVPMGVWVAGQRVI